jgi:hypothetical protein
MEKPSLRSRATEARKRQARKTEDAPCLRGFVARDQVCRWWWLAIALCVAGASPAIGQQILLDRVVARVGGVAITETDVRAAAGLGLIDVPPDRDLIPDGTRAMIDRQLVLLEVNRFNPPSPEDSAIAGKVDDMQSRAGSRLTALMQSTGLDENRLRELARDTLRIETYVNQRFGTTAQASLQEAREYYEKHPAEFTRNGTVAPFAQVETAARAAASNERRRANIAQWITDLRARGDIVEVKRQTGTP